MQKVNSRKGGEAFTFDFGPAANTRAAPRSGNGARPSRAGSANVGAPVRRASAGGLVPLPSDPPETRPAAASASRSPPTESRPSEPRRRSASNAGAVANSEASSTGTSMLDDQAGVPTTPVNPNENAVVGLPHDMSWRYEPPPNNQTTKQFVIDSQCLPPSVAALCTDGRMTIKFTSAFDSGNMIDVVQRGPLSYEIHTAADCQNSPQEVSNKAWWYFAISGVTRGVTLSLTIVSIPHCKSFSFGYAPVVACCPVRPQFSRMTNRITVVPAANPPPPKPPAGGRPGGARPGRPAARAEEERQPDDVDISFDFTFEMDDAALVSAAPHRVTPGMPVTYCFANTFPFSYGRLQRHLAMWAPHCAPQCPLSVCATHAPDPPAVTMRGPSTAPPSTAPSESAPREEAHIGGVAPCRIYTHREVLNLTPDGNRVDVLTITSGHGLAAAAQTDRREALYSELHPLSSAAAQAGTASLGGVFAEHRQILPSPEMHTQRPYAFPDRRYVVLSARVHPGEVPASHILHGAIEMLLSVTDPRADALRKNFVFVIVPMLNPDGVARGHSRADPVGQNLNRLYKDPHPLKQPTCLALRNLLLSLQKTGRLALYVDMHAHSNKKGAFLFGNAMDGVRQVQNLLYAKLASMNSPYLDFPSCNFSEGNMFAVGKGGGGKDGSSRVMLFTETGFTHSYTLEMNYITGPPVNGVAKLANVPGEENESITGAPCPKYGPPVFHDVGRGLLSALLDLQGLNPASRLPGTSYKNARGVGQWIQRCLLVDAWEQQRRQHALATGIPLSQALGKANGVSGNSNDLGFTPCAPNELPAVVTTRPSATFPPTTTRNLSELAAGYTAASVTGAENSAAVSAASGARAAAAARRRSTLAAAAGKGKARPDKVAASPARGSR
eukprot:CAMPEP_0174847534 /NCGR_PEP_ID=MMETSP1114-20130205/12967_1 /TAXON_ID=312471 /ORGANISM="Neobodo designis, Strain CCAP 1951/1" /LENGTH=894 /DNA_ID=CAMNT_0016081815 /DNA_START=34 /DNA_END=2719 /DNA_ORIENTATION=+